MITFTNSLDFSQIVNNSLTGIIIFEDKEIIYANRFVYQLLGYEINEHLVWDDILHPSYHHICQQRLRSVVMDKQTVEPIEEKLISKDGSNVEVEVFATPYIQNKKVYAQIHIHDITKRKLYEEESIENEQQYQLVVENMSDIITEINFKGIVQYISPSVKKLLGYSTSELIGNHVFNFIHQDDKASLLKIYMQVRASKRSSSVFRTRIKCKTGDYLWVASKIKMSLHTSKKRLTIDSRDITEKVEAEKLLRQSEKLAIIGELSAGVVHEIKNPLTSIKGFLQLMKAGTIKTNDYINILNSEVSRIEQLASDLLGFAKPKEEMKEQDMLLILKDVLFLLNSQATDKNIELLLNYKEGFLKVFGDQSQLKQIFINLIKNAMEASKENGKVEIYLSKRKNEIVIQIKDYGCGIPKENLEKMGESFFTTKEKGTGLGLMITHKILANHQGKIEIESIVDEGTTFTLTFPEFT